MSMITAVVAAFDASTKHLRGTVNAEKTHCKHGHELAGENLSIYTYRGTKHSGVLSPVRFGRPRRCGEGPAGPSTGGGADQWRDQSNQTYRGTRWRRWRRGRTAERVVTGGP